MIKLTPFLSLCLFLGACNSDGSKATVSGASSINLEAARTEIDAANKNFGKAMMAGDSAAVTALYHSEARAYPPNSPATDGKGMGAMSRFVNGLQLAHFDVTTKDLTPEGDMIVETGTWSIGVTGKELDNGKSLVLWKMENGHWKIWRDMWNSDNQADH